MTPRVWLTAVFVLLLARGAFAVNETSEDPVLSVQDKVDRDEQVRLRVQALEQERERRAEAERRVERIRNLPPERVQEWIDGTLSEAELAGLSNTAQVGQAGKGSPGAEDGEPRGVARKLAVLGGVVLLLALLHARERAQRRTNPPPPPARSPGRRAAPR